MSNNDDINIREIIGQFQDSAEVIDALRSRLQGLATTDEMHRASLESTQATAQALEGITTEIREAVSAFRNTLAFADDALSAATKFLESIDLGDVKRELGTLVTEQATTRDELTNAVSALDVTIKDQLSQLQTDLSRVAEELAATKTERDEYQRWLSERDKELAATEAERDECQRQINERDKELEVLNAKIVFLPKRWRKKTDL